MITEKDYEKKKSAQYTALNFPSESAEMIEFKMSHLTCITGRDAAYIYDYAIENIQSHSCTKWSDLSEFKAMLSC